MSWRRDYHLIYRAIKPNVRYEFTFLADRKVKDWAIGRTTLERWRAEGILVTVPGYSTLVRGEDVIQAMHKLLKDAA